MHSLITPVVYAFMSVLSEPPSIPFEREQQHFIETTPNSAECYQDVFRLNEALVAGKRVLDVGAGASDFTDWVNGVGGMGVATDLRYGVIPLGSMSDVVTERFADRLLTTAEILGRFSTSMLSPEGRYVNSYTGALSFKDNSFDLVVSNLLIYHHLMYRADFTIDASLALFEELLRVTKPGGKIKIAPSAGVHGSSMLEMTERVVKWFDLLDELTQQNRTHINEDEKQIRSEALLFTPLLFLFKNGKIEHPRFYKAKMGGGAYTLELIKKETRSLDI